MKRTSKLILALSLSFPLSGAFADPAAQAQTPQPAPSAPAVKPVQPATTGAHLGVLVQPLPPALLAQLPPDVAHGQGVMVVQVQPDSPATQAGLQNFDVLLSYDDQKLFSPDQLSALVSSDKPGREVALKVLRSGKVSEVKVKLGQGRPRMTMQRRSRTPMPLPRPMMPRPPEQHPQAPRVIEHFESLKVERIGDDHFRAVIEYTGADGQLHSHSYEGSRQEIRKQVIKTRDLPPPARRQLLNALGMAERGPFPGFDGPLVPEALFQRWQSQHGWNWR